MRWARVPLSWHEQFSVTGCRGIQHCLPEIALGMAGAAVPCCTHQPVHTLWPLRREQFIDIALAIANANELRVRTARLQRRQVRKPLEPLDAFLLVDRPGFALRGTASGSFGASPRFHAQHSERQPLRTNRQQTMHHEATLIATGTGPQAFCGMQMRQVEFGSVLYGQHHRNLLHAVQRLRNMRRQHAVSVHQIVVKESIGRLQFSGRQRLRQRRMWTGRQLACQRNQSLRQASVPEIRLREFLACPVRRVVPGRQSAFAASTEWAKVNTVRSSLQPDLWVKLSSQGAGRSGSCDGRNGQGDG